MATVAKCVHGLKRSRSFKALDPHMKVSRGYSKNATSNDMPESKTLTHFTHRTD